MTTWLDWAHGLEATLQVPETPSNDAALLAWMAGEQPPQSPNAAFNPLNIQNADFAGKGYTKSKFGQWNFPDLQTGIDAVAFELNTKLYAPIKQALAAGNNATAVVQAIQASPWAAGHYGGHLTGVLANVLANPTMYASGRIAGAPPGGSTTLGQGAVTGGTGSGVEQVGLTNDLLAPLTGGLSELFDLPGLSNVASSTAGGIASGIAAGITKPLVLVAFVAGGLALLVMGAKQSVQPAIDRTKEQAGQAATVAAMAM